LSLGVTKKTGYFKKKKIRKKTMMMMMREEITKKDIFLSEKLTLKLKDY
jgi:hypothetical protein